MNELKKVNFAPPNSLVFLSGVDNFEVPLTMGDAIVVETSSCLAIGCMSELDGLTEFIIATSIQSTAGLKLVFSGRLVTPNGQLKLTTIYDANIIEVQVKKSSVEVAIWVNDLKEPDKILICAT